VPSSTYQLPFASGPITMSAIPSPFTSATNTRPEVSQFPYTPVIAVPLSVIPFTWFVQVKEVAGRHPPLAGHSVIPVICERLVVGEVL
jgi:hypothetical protein